MNSLQNCSWIQGISRRLALILCVLLPGGIAVAGSGSEATILKFAETGRADVTRLRLSCGMSAKVTVAALCKVMEKEDKGYSFSTQDVASRQADRPQSASLVMKLIEIPKKKRGTIRIRFETQDPMIRRSVLEAVSFISKVVGSHRLPTSEIRIRVLPVGKTRAYAMRGQSAIYLNAGRYNVKTAVHEIAHHVEFSHPVVLAGAKRFILRRAESKEPVAFQILGGPQYKEHEKGLVANWGERGGIFYTGKVYGSSLKEASATEVISTGLARLYQAPAVFFRKDADHFLFLLLVLQAE